MKLNTLEFSINFAIDGCEGEFIKMGIVTYKTATESLEEVINSKIEEFLEKLKKERVDDLDKNGNLTFEYVEFVIHTNAITHRVF